MKAVVFDQTSSGMEIVLREIPTPTPGDHDILYRVNAFGLNQADLLLTQGRHYVSSDLPIRLGYEASGEVVEVGNKVKRIKPGDQVTCMPNVDGPYATGGEFALAHENFLTSWPKGFSAEDAAGFWMQYLTAYYPMKELFPFDKGDWVMITAASGGTGAGAMQIAKLLGAQIIATTRNPQTKGDYLKQAGADHVVATYGETLVDDVLEITGPAGVRLICDSVGGEQSGRYAQTLTDQGVIYVHGGLSGSNQLAFDVLTLVRKGAGLFGYSLINELRKPGMLERGRNFVLKAIAKKQLSKPTIAKVFPFSAAPQAYEYMRTGGQKGKIIVSHGQSS